MAATQQKEVLTAGLAAARHTPQTVAHPVEGMLRELAAERMGPSKIGALALGQGFDVRQRMELQILSQFRRPSVLPSSRVALDTLLDLDEDIDFCDYLGEPIESLAPPDIHRAMEAQLNL